MQFSCLLTFNAPRTPTVWETFFQMPFLLFLSFQLLMLLSYIAEKPDTTINIILYMIIWHVELWQRYFSSRVMTGQKYMTAYMTVELKLKPYEHHASHNLTIPDAYFHDCILKMNGCKVSDGQFTFSVSVT